MQSRSRSIKTLDHAMSGQAGTQSCETFVEAMGLKYLFSALMGKVHSLALLRFLDPQPNGTSPISCS